jgi:hypothetical protein
MRGVAYALLIVTGIQLGGGLGLAAAIVGVVGIFTLSPRG